MLEATVTANTRVRRSPAWNDRVPHRPAVPDARLGFFLEAGKIRLRILASQFAMKLVGGKKNRAIVVEPYMCAMFSPQFCNKKFPVPFVC